MKQDSKKEKVKAEDLASLQRNDSPLEDYWECGFEAALQLHAERHGQWLETFFRGMPFQKCSACLYLLKTRSTYCPHCGARMDGNG